MIMVCDNLDGKELIRERLFSRWYMRYNDGSVRKCDASLETDGYSLFVSLYMRFDNPNAKQQKETLLQSLATFAVDLQTKGLGFATKNNPLSAFNKNLKEKLHKK